MDTGPSSLQVRAGGTGSRHILRGGWTTLWKRGMFWGFEQTAISWRYVSLGGFLSGSLSCTSSVEWQGPHLSQIAFLSLGGSAQKWMSRLASFLSCCPFTSNKLLLSHCSQIGRYSGQSSVLWNRLSTDTWEAEVKMAECHLQRSYLKTSTKQNIHKTKHPQNKTSGAMLAPGCSFVSTSTDARLNKSCLLITKIWKW